MKSRARILLVAPWLALALAGLAGCPGPGTGNDAGTPDGGGGFQCENKPDGTDVLECRRNIDCGGGSICEKAAEGDEFGCCLKIFCTVDADCPEEEHCDLRRGICVPDNLCDPGAGCPNGEFCVYGDGTPQCIAEAAAPATCQISPNPIFTTSGQAVEVQAAGFQADGKLSPHASFTYAVAGLTNGNATGNSLSADCADAAPCTGTVTATANGGASCTADLVVYPAVPGADVRVTLFDQTSGAPVSGAPVAARVSGALVEGTTDADGSYTFTGAAGNVEAISAFPANHQWQTVVGPTGNDIALFTVEVPDDTQVAGVKGQFDFSGVSTQGDIKLGLAGMSISAAITDLDFATLLGEIADYNIVLDGVTDADGEIVPLPSGLVLELGPEKIKGDFVTLGSPGKSTLWALGGKVRLSEIGPIISSVTSADNINVGSILSAVLPFFARFDHAVVSGLDLSATTRPTAPADGTPVPYADWNFPELTGADAVKLDTLLSHSADYSVPTLPCKAGAYSAGGCTGNAYSSGAVLLSGVLVPGQGLVPLGLTAGLDDPDDQDANDQVDGQVDHKGENPPQKGHVILDFAPPHDGLEGNRYVTIAIGLDIEGLTGGSLAASTITHITDKYGASNLFPTPFLEHQGGTFTKTAGAGVSFTMNAVGDADFYRLNLDDGGAGEWNIWFSDPNATITLADLRPAGITGRDQTVDVQAFAFGTGYDGATPDNFADLMAFNGTNLDNLLFYMGGWSSLTCAAPDAENPTPFCAEETQ